MAQIKITKEELKHDEVLETTDKVLRWIKAHLNTILGVVALLFAVYAVATYMHNSQRNSLVRANDLLADAQARYNMGVIMTDWSTPERIEAMNEVVRLTNQILDEFAGSPVARQALFLQGTAYFSAGDDVIQALQGGAPNTDNAVSTFTRYISEAQTPLERAKGNLALASAYENMLFLTQQSSYYQDAVLRYRMIHEDAQAPGFVRAEAMLAEARLEAFQGRTQRAEELYRRVIEMRADEPEQLEEGEELRPERAFVLQLREVLDQFSHAGTARTELQRLGVEVEQE